MLAVGALCVDIKVNKIFYSDCIVDSFDLLSIVCIRMVLLSTKCVF